MSKVSILMNAYNSEAFLKEAIDSIYAQSYDDWEIIFIDNCSSDTTAAIAKSYDDKLKYYKTDYNIPLYSARNFGFQFVNGKYLAFLDTDDLWLPDKLERQVAMIESTGSKLVYSNFYVLNQSSNKMRPRHNRVLPSGHILDSLLENYCVGLVTILMDVEFMRENKIGFREDFQIIGDFDIVIKYAKTQYISVVQEPLAVYRIHGGNLSFTESDKTVYELIQWREQAVLEKEIKNKINFVDDKIAYLKVKSHILNGEKCKALKNLKFVNEGKIKLLLAILSPDFLLKKITN